MLSLVGADGALDLYDGSLRARDADGAILFDRVDYSRYRELIFEEVKPWIVHEVPVPPLARAGSRLVQGRPAGAGAELRPHPHAAGRSATRREFIDFGGGQPMHAPLAYHWARMIEMLHRRRD